MLQTALPDEFDGTDLLYDLSAHALGRYAYVNVFLDKDRADACHVTEVRLVCFT